MTNPGTGTKPSGFNRKTLMGSDQSVKSHVIHITNIRISVVNIRIQVQSLCFRLFSTLLRWWTTQSPSLLSGLWPAAPALKSLILHQVSQREKSFKALVAWGCAPISRLCYPCLPSPPADFNKNLDLASEWHFCPGYTFIYSLLGFPGQCYFPSC